MGSDASLQTYLQDMSKLVRDSSHASLSYLGTLMKQIQKGVSILIIYPHEHSNIL